MEQYDAMLNNILRPLKNPMVTPIITLGIFFYAVIAAPPLPGYAKNFLQTPYASFIVAFLILYTNLPPTSALIYAAIFTGALYAYNKYYEGFEYQWTNHPGYPLNPYGTAMQLDAMGYNSSASDEYPSSVGGNSANHAQSPQTVWDMQCKLGGTCGNSNVPEPAENTKEQFANY